MLDGLSNIVEAVVSAKTLVSVCNQLTISLGNMLKVYNVSVYLISQSVKDLYHSARPSSEPLSKTKISSQVIEIHKQQGIDVELPVFKSLHELNHPIRREDFLVATAYLNMEKGLAVQCKSKINAQGRKVPFNGADEYILKVICNVIGLKLRALTLR